MAFLCPARIKKFTVKAKQRRVRRLSETDAPLGRITGSASIDTLVRVGLEKEQLQLDPTRPRQRVLVLHDFQPCVDDELAVTKGQSVVVLYRENDWLYVTAANGKEGFVPFIYCSPQGTAITDDIHVGARSTYLTNGVASKGPTTGTTDGDQIKDRPGNSNKNNRQDYHRVAINNTQAQLNSVKVSPKTQQNNTHMNKSSAQSSSHYRQESLNNTNNTTAVLMNNTNGFSRPFSKNTSTSQTSAQGHSKALNTSKGFARGRPYNSSRSHNANTLNSTGNNYYSDNEDYLTMDNRSRHSRFQHHKYENVHVRNGLRNQGPVRHSSEDRYGAQQRPQVQHTRHHSLERSDYGGYGREYRPLQNGSRNQGRQRHSSQDTRGQRARQRSNSRESHNSSNMQTFQNHSRQNNSQVGRQNNSQVGRQHNSQVGRQNNSQVQNSTTHAAKPGHASSRVNNSRLPNIPNNSRLSSNSHNISNISHTSNHKFNMSNRQNLPKDNQRNSQGSFHPVQNRGGHQELDSVGSWGDQDRSSTSDTQLLDTTEITSFMKKPHGRYIVLFPFTGQEEGDVGVNRGEFVTVLNKDDADWFYIRRANGAEGFVPSSFLCPAEGQYEDIGNRITSFMTPPRMSRQVSADSTRLVCLYDYTATASDDLSITRGEWLYADLQDQVEDSWLWAYSPGTKRYGYVPRAYAKPPNTNGLIANPLDPYLSP